MKSKDAKKQVLIVDDDMDMRLFLKALVTIAGYHPIMASDGENGVKLAKELLPDLIVLDIMMPNEGGAKMYFLLKTNEALKNLPVIMLSAITEATFYHYLKMLNSITGTKIPEPAAYIEKPPAPEAILEIMNELLH